MSWLTLLALALLWGTSFMFVSLSLEDFSPVGVVAMRVFLGAVVLFIVLKVKRLSLPRDGYSWGIFTLYGLVGNLLPFWLISLGQQSISSGVAGLLMASMPLFTMILAHFFVAGEQLNRFKLLGFCLGIIGVFIILSPGLQGANNTLIGILLVLLASLSYAVNSILVRVLPPFDSITAGAGMLISASLLMVPIWFIQDMPWQNDYGMTALSSLIWLGIGPTGLAILLYFSLIRQAGPTFMANTNYLIPVVAYVMGAAMLNEAVEWQSVVALALILLGIGLTRKVPK